jgi:cytochrome c553
MKTTVLTLTVAGLLMAGCGQRAGDGSAGSPAAASAASTAAAGTPAVVPVPVAAVASEPAPTPADLDAGARLASQGSGAAPACSGCHGAHGEGQAAARFPRLAGLGAAYLREQLDSYADGRRQNAVMQPIATALQPDQRRIAAAYFASLDPAAAAGPASPAPPAQGRAAQLAWVGDEGRQLMACANCHGRDGGGLGERIPPLAGQPAGYLDDSLAAWRNGTRHNDPSGEMPRIAKALGPADAQALAAWYAGLPMPPPANRRPAAFTSALAPVTSGPVAAASGVQGSGTEQGALTGGAVGPGGTGATQQQPPQAQPPAPQPNAASAPR